MAWESTPYRPSAIPRIGCDVKLQNLERTGSKLLQRPGSESFGFNGLRGNDCSSGNHAAMADVGVAQRAAQRKSDQQDLCP